MILCKEDYGPYYTYNEEEANQKAKKLNKEFEKNPEFSARVEFIEFPIN